MDRVYGRAGKKSLAGRKGPCLLAIIAPMSLLTFARVALSRWSRTALLRAFAVAALSSSCALADGLPELGDASGSDLSATSERRLGESIMRDIRLREPSYLDDPEVESYLNDIGHRLAAHAEEVGGSYRFFPINDNSINAFAMFGGFIGVNTGLILSSQTESELAAVLAHEVSHVSQRHLARQVAKGKQTTLASVLAIALAVIAARSNADVIGATLAASEAASIQSQLAFTRDFEREADRVGLELMEKSGFDPHGMPQFFERLHRSTRVYESGAPIYMRSHPMTVDRMSDMENRTVRIPFKQVPSSLDFHLIRAKLNAMQGTPAEAIKKLGELLRERKFVSEPAAYYGYALALQRAERFAVAEAGSALPVTCEKATPPRSKTRPPSMMKVMPLPPSGWPGSFCHGSARKVLPSAPSSASAAAMMRCCRPVK